MKTLWMTMLVVLLGTFSFNAVALADDDGDENETKIKLKDCPKAVQKTIKKEAKAGKILEIEKETDDDKTIYEAEIMIKGKKWEIEVAPSGKLLSKKQADDDEDEDDEEDEDKDEPDGDNNDNDGDNNDNDDDEDDD